MFKTLAVTALAASVDAAKLQKRLTSFKEVSPLLSTSINSQAGLLASYGNTAYDWVATLVVHPNCFECGISTKHFLNHAEETHYSDVERETEVAVLFQVAEFASLG